MTLVSYEGTLWAEIYTRERGAMDSAHSERYINFQAQVFEHTIKNLWVLVHGEHLIQFRCLLFSVRKKYLIAHGKHTEIEIFVRPGTYESIV